MWCETAARCAGWSAGGRVTTLGTIIDVTAGLMDTAPPWISSFAYVMHHCSVHTHDLLDAWVYPKAAVLRPRHCESPRTRRRHTDRRNPSPFYTSADRVAYVSCSRAQYNRRGHDGVGGMRRRAHICARGCIPPAASWLCEEGTVTFERFSSVDHDYHIYESSSAAFVWAKPILLFTVASLILNGIDLMTTKPIIEAIFRATLQSTSAHIFVAVRSLIFLTLPQLVADVVGILSGLRAAGVGRPAGGATPPGGSKDSARKKAENTPPSRQINGCEV